MNDKQIPANASTKVDMADLDKLEDELNDLSKSVNLDDPPANPPSEPLGGFSNMFNFGNSKPYLEENTPLVSAIISAYLNTFFTPE